MYIIITITVIFLIAVRDHIYVMRKENLNSDGQQFYHYQQNEQPPLTLNQRIQKRQRHLYIDHIYVTLKMETYHNQITFHIKMKKTKTYNINS